ncbi:hypothetical protein GALMADRAFT_142756 [Galerina marginata CBS 339.88]|uniref:Zinc/iron permease n=1 Tax=Galerina marginata (strain CBS 339.88) TaxID=685588 RepID=A0A067SQ51_GALM3|nr:hypothetical protein GALMADRAFT_142756 [Galerina marginata CBS 339.88]
MSARSLGVVVAAVTAGNTDDTKMWVMVIILAVSLFAVSFPTISKKVPFLRIPGIVFFIGKHFGTGVILATAFIHLLDDAFRSLQDRRVEERYGNLGKWTGCIILFSLLAIFVVEYVSTTYVEHLQEKSSAPSTPVPSRPSSPTHEYRTQHEPQSQTRITHSPALLSETTPLLAVPVPIRSRSLSTPGLPAPARTQTYPLPAPPIPGLTHSHQRVLVHTHAPPIPVLPIDVLANSPRVCRMVMARDHVHLPKKFCEGEDREMEEEDELEIGREHGHGHGHDHEHEREVEGKPRVGRRRQVVGLLVLQLGIMIHSFVIGLTLSVTSGADFTSLTTAIIFHQLFEGLSLGIRIAGLPPAPKSTPKHEVEEDEEEDDCDESDSNVGRHVHFTSETSHPCASASRHTSKVARSSASPRRRRQLQTTRWKWGYLKNQVVKTWMRARSVQWLKPTLTFLFGVTTPVGMGVGMVLWKGKGAGGGANGEDASMLLIQGIMSAISAGLLIYAATVEMIAGDFVFGDVEGHHHHHHHQHEAGEDAGSHRAMDGDHDAGVREAELGGELEELEAELEEGEGGGRTASVGKRVLAVTSLFAGAVMMVLVGLGE